MVDYDKYSSDKLIRSLSEGLSNDQEKDKIIEVLLRRAIEGGSIEPKEFFINYYLPIVKGWIGSSVSLNGISTAILKNKREDWEHEVFRRFFEAVKGNKFTWKNTASTSKYLKTICYITVIDDEEVNIRAYKREVQRSIRINIKNNRLTKNDEDILLNIISETDDNSNNILKWAIKGYTIREISGMLKGDLGENQKLWNLRESGYWRMYKYLERKIQISQENTLILIKNKLISEVRPHRL